MATVLVCKEQFDELLNNAVLRFGPTFSCSAFCTIPTHCGISPDQTIVNNVYRIADLPY